MIEAVLVGTRIKEKRKQKGYSQADLAGRISMSPQMISKWENGDVLPDVAILDSIAFQLDTTLNYLVYGKEEEKAQDVKEKKGKPYAYTKWRDCDYSKVTMENEQLNWAMFTNCNFDQANFNNANLLYTEMKNSSLRKCMFEEAKFHRADFKECILDGSNFTNANLANADFNKCSLIDCVLKGINGNGISFQASNVKESLISDASFERAYFYNTVFENICFNNVFFKECIFKHVTFINCKMDKKSYLFMQTNKVNMDGITIA